MEDKDMLRTLSIATATRHGQIGSVQDIIFNCLDGVQVDCTGDMSTGVFIVKSAVNDSIGCNSRVVEPRD